MKPGRWTAVSQSAFDWEREALDFLRQHLPDHEPWRAWSNFEFIDDEGRVNEVDVLVLTPVGLVLVEVKSRPGSVRGDAYSWTWTTEGRQLITDNPLPLANRKAKRLAFVLRRQEAIAARGLSRAAAGLAGRAGWSQAVAPRGYGRQSRRERTRRHAQRPRPHLLRLRARGKPWLGRRGDPRHAACRLWRRRQRSFRQCGSRPASS